MNNLVGDVSQHVDKACSDDRSPVEAFATMDQHVLALFQAFSHPWQRLHELKVAQFFVPRINVNKLAFRRSIFWVLNREVLPNTVHYQPDVAKCLLSKLLRLHVL